MEPDTETKLQKAGLIAGPIIAITMLTLPAPDGLTAQAWSVAAVSLLMGIWWMTEAIPLAATALLPIVLFPALGIGDLTETAPSYANPLIFLFLGGFLMAKAMVRQHLSQRIALGLLKYGNPTLPGIVASMMIATAFLSMWVSNTATTMMMMPIGQSIIIAASVRAAPTEQPSNANFSTALMLAIAYSATIGGMGTLIGTPPNALFAGFMAETYGIEIEFWRWMIVGVPAVIILLPLAWFVLTKFAFRLDSSGDVLSRDFVHSEFAKLGRFTRAELLVSVILGSAAVMWMFRDVISTLVPQLHLSDAGIAVSAAILLFILPASRVDRRRLLSWDDAATIRWDILILFGGGLALAGAINTSGLAVWIGQSATILSALPTLLFLLGVFTIIVLLGELASNTAVAAIFLPVAGASASGLGFDTGQLVMSVALAATIGFMLPVATPPNAIVFGGGTLKIPDMIKAGAVLDVIAIIVVAIIAITIGPLVF